METTRKPPTCSHCLEVGHTKASQECPLKGMPPADRIPTKPSSHWTEEQEKQLVGAVATCTLPTDWTRIAEDLNRKELACRNRYHGLVKPLEEVRIRGRLLVSSPAFIQSIADGLRNKCDKCPRVFYDGGHKWQGKVECDECYRLHCAERRVLWKGIENAYHSCTWCGRERSKGVCLQLDHLNMFEKGDSVCTMIDRGETLEKIIAEAEQCQVLCASCHSVVTSVERQLGMHRAKGALTRSAAGVEPDMLSIGEDYAKLVDVYAMQMNLLYPIIRESIGQQHHV